MNIVLNKNFKTFEIVLTSTSKNSLFLYKTFIFKILDQIGIIYTNVDFPVFHKKITLLKSPHVNKKAKEQFQLSDYKSVIFLESKKIFFYANIILINKPKSVKLEFKSNF
jgi:small subunit ribosomal protein S10